jgi:hypothetical protein
VLLLKVAKAGSGQRSSSSTGKYTYIAGESAAIYENAAKEHLH